MMVQLGEVMDQIRGVSYKGSDAQNSPSESLIPILRATNIQDSRVTETDFVYVPNIYVKERQFIKKNDVLIAASSGSISIVGKAAAIQSNLNASFGAFCKVLRPNKELIDSKYFKYYFETLMYLKTIRHLAEGANINNLKTEHFNNLQIPLPPLPTQKKIAAILDAADELRQKDKELIAKYDELAQSLFLDMFGDPVTNPFGWEKIKLEELCSIRRGASPRPIKDFVGGNIPWIKIGDGTGTNDIYIDKTKEAITQEGAKKSVILEPGSLIFANCGVSLGFARIIRIRGCIHDGWLAFENLNEDSIDAIFLLKTLNSVTDYFRRTAPDGTQPNLNTSIMKNYEIPVPPIDMQHEFVKSIGMASDLRKQANGVLGKSEELFQSLLQQAFKGELVK